MDRTSVTGAQTLTHIAPPQILKDERSFAIFFAVLFFGLWSLPIWGALTMPTVLAYIVALYDVYWAIQALYSAMIGLVSYQRMQVWDQIDWRTRYSRLGQTVHQIVVIPNYRERIEKLGATLERLADCEYPTEHLHIVLALEEREEGAAAKGELLRAQFASHFGQFWVTSHPLMPDETAGKGANLAYALRQIKKQCDGLGWDSAHVVVTTIDADTRLHTKYLAALAVQFLTVPDPTRKFFQGILLLLNNIWEVHAPIRALSAFWTFTYITGVTHYQRMTTAVYSMSLRLLDDIGYWDPRIVAEDGHIFFRAFFALKGKPDIHPIYLPVGLDAVEHPSVWQALRIQYRQMLRWAWTVSNLPFIANQWVRHPEIAFTRKMQKVLPYVEGLLILPSSWFIITFGVILPPLINPSVHSDVFGWPLAVLSPLILTPTLLGVVIALVINIRLRAQYARRVAPVSFIYRVLQSFEWLLVLANAVFYFGVPYVMAYWRMLRGNDLQYETTPK